MQNNKKILMFLILIIIISLISYYFYNKNKIVTPTNIPNILNTNVVYGTIYSNKDYGFAFTLPNTWTGYSIEKNTWEGNPLNTKTKKENGPKLLIRNPKWTEALPYQDIPVLVFTITQWNSYIKENFSISAAPILASELGRNNKYVFALPARWNFDYSKDYEEANSIININPLEAFDIR